MNDASAGQATSGESDGDRLYLLYVIYNGRLVRHLRAQLGARWELAEDLAQDTWERVAKSLHTCRASDDRAFPWLQTVARSAISAHFRRARTRRETPVDFTSEVPAVRMPVAPAAEDEALADITVLAMLTEPLPVWGAAA